MKKVLIGLAAAVFIACSAGATEVRRSDEVRVDPDVQRNATVAKNKVKRGAKKAKRKTRSAARKTGDAAQRGAARVERSGERAADRVDAPRR